MKGENSFCEACIRQSVIKTETVTGAAGDHPDRCIDCGFEDFSALGVVFGGKLA